MKEKKALRVFSRMFKKSPEKTSQLLQAIWNGQGHSYDILFVPVDTNKGERIGFRRKDDKG